MHRSIREFKEKSSWWGRELEDEKGLPVCYEGSASPQLLQVGVSC